MPCPHKPRPQIDVLLGVIKLGTVPFGILLKGHFLFKDKNHILHSEEIRIIKATQSAMMLTYPVPITATLKELDIDSVTEGVKSTFYPVDIFVTTNGVLYFAFFFCHCLYIRKSLAQGLASTGAYSVVFGLWARGVWITLGT